MVPIERKTLNKKKEFDNVFTKGKSSFGRILGIKALKNELNHNRTGIIVSTKISKKAVERNRIKRQIRAAQKELEDKLLSGYNLVFITLPPIITADYKQIKKEIEKGLEKLKILKK